MLVASFKWPYREVRIGFLFIDEKPVLIFRCTRMAHSFVDQPDRFLHGRQLQIFAFDDPRCVFDHLARWKSALFDQPPDNHLTNLKFFRRWVGEHENAPHLLCSLSKGRFRGYLNELGLKEG